MNPASHQRGELRVTGAENRSLRYSVEGQGNGAQLLPRQLDCATAEEVAEAPRHEGEHCFLVYKTLRAAPCVGKKRKTEKGAIKEKDDKI